MIIVWSNEAQTSYLGIIDYLIENWEIAIVLDFEKRTNILLNHLKVHHNFCPNSKKSNLRKCILHKNVSLIYAVGKNRIELISFIDNRTSHKF